jgi:hypothetical protein
VHAARHAGEDIRVVQVRRDGEADCGPAGIAVVRGGAVHPLGPALSGIPAAATGRQPARGGPSVAQAGVARAGAGRAGGVVRGPGGVSRAGCSAIGGRPEQPYGALVS